ncbi:MAG TPA: electron transport complex subunit E [Gammaproteobacteria bacterium]|nr:electron transport complex subunit E [Gammaproteobacteria bacterium]
MADNSREIINEGLWRNNAALVQLLGLCPLLAVSGTVVNALGLGLATTLVLAGSNVTVSLIRNLVRPELRIPTFVLIIACFVTAVELLMKAFVYDLYLVLGIFIPLIVTNCVIIARAESFASRNHVGRSLLDGLAMGAGFTLVLVALGAMREVVGHGTLLAQAELMFGAGSEWLTITLIDGYRGFLLAILPPGAFIGLGLLIALKNVIDRRQQARRAAVKAAATPSSTQTTATS